MNNNGIAQPGEASPEARKEHMSITLYKQCLRSATKLTCKDKEALKQMGSDVLVQALFRDLKDIAYAEKDIIGKYYQIIGDYLEEQLRNTHTELEHERFQFLRVVKTYLLPKLETLAKEARKKGSKRNEATLESIIDRWKEQFGECASFTTDPKIPIAAISSDTKSYLESPVIQAPSFLQSTKTVMGMPAFNPQPAPARPAQPEVKANKPVHPPSENEISPGFGESENHEGSEDPATDSTDVLPILRAPTHPAVQTSITKSALQNAAKIDPTNVDALKGTLTEPTTIIDRPPKDELSPNNYGQGCLQTLRQKRQTNTGTMYNNPNLTLLDILKISGDNRETTGRDLQEKMAQSFQTLRAEITSPNNLDEKLQQKILQCIRTAFERVVSTQYRKRLMHEFFDLLKSTKDANKRKIIIQMFELALSSKLEFKQPIQPSERMQRIYEKSETKAPKTTSPSVFTQAQEILGKAELAEMPEDLRDSLTSLFTISQKLGLNNMPMSGVTPHSIASMQDQDFAMTCYQTLNILREVDEKVGNWTNPATWGGKRRKARKFIAKLKKIIPEQLAVIEQLLYSKNLFIPKEPTQHSLSLSHSQKSA